MNDNDHSAVEHFVLSELLEVAVTRDQLDVSNLMTFELIVRRMQVREETQRQKLDLKRQESDPGGQALTTDFFGGRPKMAGGAIICPSLLTYVSKRVQEESELVKQQRKALEARKGAAGGKK